MKTVKNQVVILAFDDGPHNEADLARNSHNHNKDSKRTVPLIGVTCRGNQLLHVTKSIIEVDGIDSTDELLNIYYENPYKDEIRIIMIDSPTLAGFNPPNPFYIHEITKIPVILLPDRTPDSNICEVYAKIFPKRTEQIEYLKRLPPLQTMTMTINSDPHIHRDVYFHVIGASKTEVISLLDYLSLYSAIPEPLRLAHIIASRFELK